MSLENPERIGERVAGWRLVRRIGSGGMGAVYEALRDDNAQRVAIKILHPELRHHPAAGRFLAEARAAARLRHPGVVAALGGGRLADGRPYVITELLTGAPLAELLPPAGSAPQGAALCWALRRLLEISEALSAVHRAGVIHRDLKPQNVFVVADAQAPDGVRCKLLDFGLARLSFCAEDTRADTQLRTRPGMAIGTPRYMAPEQCLGQGAVTDRVDAYALGVMLYRVLAGRMPFGAALTGELLAQQIHAPAPPLPESAPPALRALTLALLRKDPRLRPSVAVAQDTLQAWLRSSAAPRAAEPAPASMPTTLVFRVSLNDLALPPPAVAPPPPGFAAGWVLALLGALMILSGC